MHETPASCLDEVGVAARGVTAPDEISPLEDFLRTKGGQSH
jgi:hypothetical protein